MISTCTYLADHLCKDMDLLTISKMNNQNIDFVYNKENLVKVQKDIKKHGIRNTHITAIKPGYTWAANDLGTVEESIEAFEKMSKQEQGFFLAMFEASMAMQGIIPAREDNKLRRLYYSQGKGEKNEER